MCGITAIFNIHGDAASLRQQALKMSKRIRHRGPDWSGIYQGQTAILAHERLSIVDPASGGQPLKSKDGKLILTVNGEIYNHREIREQLKGEYDFQTGSDCEVILASIVNMAWIVSKSLAVSLLLPSTTRKTILI